MTGRGDHRRGFATRCAAALLALGWALVGPSDSSCRAQEAQRRPTGQDIRIEGPNPAEVALGAQAVLRICWVGAQTAIVEPTPPLRVEGLRIRSRRLRVAQPTFEWTLTPSRPGRFELPPPALLVDGRRVAAADPITLSCALDSRGEAFATLDVTPMPRRARYFVGESLTLRFVIEIDREFATTNLQNTLGRPLDLPVRVLGTWLDPTRPGPDLKGAAGRPTTLVFDRATLTATERAATTRDGKRRRVLEFVRTLPLDAPGPRVVPRATLTFDYATEFGADLFGDPRPTNREIGRVYSEPIELLVDPLPRQGRPPEFTGALGRFVFDASITPIPGAEESLWRLEVRLRAHESSPAGTTPWDRVRLPRLDSIDGIHVRGMTRSPHQDHLAGTYEILLTDPKLASIPPLRFASFDPTEPAGYRITRTARLAIPGRPASSQQPTTSNDPTKDVPETPNVSRSPVPPWEVTPLDRAPSDHPVSTRGLGAWLGLLAPWAIACSVWWWLRRRRFERECPGRRAAMRAARAFERMANRRNTANAAERRDAMSRYLAARFRLRSSAVIAPSLANTLTSQGLDAAVADRVARGMRRLVDADYGGEAPAPDWTDLQRLVSEVEATMPRDPRHALQVANPGSPPRPMVALHAMVGALLTLGLPSWAEPPQGGSAAASQLAHTAFEERRYEDAQQLFLDALPSTPGHRAITLENAAICAHLAGRDADALWLIERALRNRPGDDRIEARRAALIADLVRTPQAESPTDTAPEGSLSESLARSGQRIAQQALHWARTRSATEYAWIGALLQTLGLLALVCWIERRAAHPRTKPPRRRHLVWASALILTGASVAGLAIRQAMDSRPLAIVVVDRAGATTAPHRSSPKAFELTAGARLRLDARTDRWLAVTQTHEHTGVTRSGYLRTDTARIVTR